MTADEDLRVGRAAISRGLVSPGDLLAALEERRREAARGKSMTLGDVLVRKKKLTPSVLEALKVTARPRHQPTVKLADKSWRPIGAPALAFEPPSSDVVIPDTKPSPPPTAKKAVKKLGSWILEEQLGRGGMGIIFTARHEKYGDRVAVKVLRDPNKPSLVERFTRETSAVRRLQHENIVRILDQGDEGKCPWFAMELVLGKTLAQLIGERSLLPRQAVEVLRVVARAVHHAHERDVLHRDLKPANVLVAHNGTVKVSDFGLAKLTDDDESALTRPGVPIGTPAYMSPEQALGGEADRRTDVFSLGVMLFEAVSGKLPWSSERLAKLYVGERLDLPPMKRGDKALEAIVVRATQKRPEDRFQSAEAFARELDAWLEGSVPATSRLIARLARVKGFVARAFFALAVALER